MKTVTLTEARSHLGELCKSAKEGGEIGIVAGDTIFQLVPVEVAPTHPGEIRIIPMTSDYIKKEYGLSSQEAEKFLVREEVRYQSDKKKGRIVRYKGKFDAGKFD